MCILYIQCVQVCTLYLNLYICISCWIPVANILKMGLYRIWKIQNIRNCTVVWPEKQSKHRTHEIWKVQSGEARVLRTRPVSTCYRLVTIWHVKKKLLSPCWCYKGLKNAGQQIARDCILSILFVTLWVRLMTTKGQLAGAKKGVSFSVSGGILHLQGRAILSTYYAIMIQCMS